MREPTSRLSGKAFTAAQHGVLVSADCVNAGAALGHSEPSEESAELQGRLDSSLLPEPRLRFRLRCHRDSTLPANLAARGFAILGTSALSSKIVQTGVFAINSAR